MTTAIDARDYLDAKLAAMRAHATQIAVDSPFFALSDMVGQRALGTEYYTCWPGPPGLADAGGREPDLFAGLQPAEQRSLHAPCSGVTGAPGAAPRQLLTSLPGP